MKFKNLKFARAHLITRLAQPATLGLLTCLAGYLGFIFPRCYFRHDDWLILGNSVVRMPHEWSLFWKPTLYYGPAETVWFFRPLFKGIVLVLYRAFGLNYYAWLVALLALFVGAVNFTAKAIVELTASRLRAAAFVILFVGCVPFHFGSLVWMGEGSMNIPQIFLLSANTCYFARYLKRGRSIDAVLAIAAYVLSLGFKESSVLHPFFLLFIGGVFARRRVGSLAPYVILGGSFLVVRLFWVPLNSSYLPHYDLTGVLKPSLIFMAVFALPWLTLALIQPGKLPATFAGAAQKIAYALFFVPCLAPYLGHGFFSPGWLLLPGFYYAICFSLWLPADYALPKRFLAGLVILSLIPVIIFLQRLGWWQWHSGQREIVQIVSRAPKNYYRQLTIEECPNPEYPRSTLERVIGFEAAVSFLWQLHHAEVIPVRFVPCGSNYFAGDPKTLRLQWQFPRLTRISAPSQVP